MSRIKIPHHLPALDTLLPDYKGFSKDRPKSHQLKELLISICNRLRNGSRQRFYPVRELAEFFNIHHSLALNAYNELEKEGILHRERSAGTFLQPDISVPRHPIRGIIGVPIWSYGYCNFSDWRLFLDRIEESLRKRHYIANFIFFKTQDVSTPELWDRIISHNLDWIIWFLPLEEYTMPLQKIQDKGVKILIIPEKDTYLPFPTYRINYYRAIQHGMKHLKSEGIQKMITFVLNSQEAVRDLHQTIHLPEKLGFSHQIYNLQKNDIHAFLKEKHDLEKTALVFNSIDVTRHLSSYFLNEFLTLVKSYRVMTLGYIELPPFILKECQADMIVINWRDFADKIVNDLVSRTIQRNQPLIEFEATYLNRESLSEYSIQY